MPKMTSSNCLFCLITRQKPKDDQFTIIEDWDNHKIFKFEKPNQDIFTKIIT